MRNFEPALQYRWITCSRQLQTEGRISIRRAFRESSRAAERTPRVKALEVRLYYLATICFYLRYTSTLMFKDTGLLDDANFADDL